ANVDGVAVDSDRMSPERSDGIDDKQRASIVSQLAKTVQFLKHSRGGLGVNDRKRARLARIKRGFNVGSFDRATPLRPHQYGLSACALDYVAHAFAEDSVYADHHFIVRLDNVDERRFHAGASGRRNWNRHPIVSLKHISKHRLDVV